VSDTKRKPYITLEKEAESARRKEAGRALDQRYRAFLAKGTAR